MFEIYETSTTLKFNKFHDDKTTIFFVKVIENEFCFHDLKTNEFNANIFCTLKIFSTSIKLKLDYNTSIVNDVFQNVSRKKFHINEKIIMFCNKCFQLKINTTRLNLKTIKSIEHDDEKMKIYNEQLKKNYY